MFKELEESSLQELSVGRGAPETSESQKGSIQVRLNFETLEELEGIE